MAEVPHNKPPVKYPQDSLARILWLLAGFIPSMAAIVCFKQRFDAAWVWPALLLLNLALSFVSAAGIIRGMKDVVVGNCLYIFLGVILFMANLVIALSVGCSGMRIAP